MTSHQTGGGVIFRSIIEVKISRSKNFGPFIYINNILLYIYHFTKNQYPITNTQENQRRKCEGSSPTSLRPISYFGSIFRPKNHTLVQEKEPAIFSHGQGTHCAPVTVKSRAVDRSTIQFLIIFRVLLTETCY